MKKLINISLSIIGLLVLSCEDILEEDISNDLITIINPAEGDEEEGNTVDFLWNELEGATDYQVQVYSENTIIEDTILNDLSFSTILESGSYEWRIKGLNNGYETSYNFPVNFGVIESANLTNQTLILNSPSDNLYTNERAILFVWSPLSQALTYNFQLEKITDSGSTIQFFEKGIKSTSIMLDENTIDLDTQYLWSVKAVNDSSESQYFSRTLFIDTTPPLTPNLITPEFEEEFTLADTVILSWEINQGNAAVNSPESSYYEIATDVDFTTVIESNATEITSINYRPKVIGTYYWRVKGNDEAGNSGNFNMEGKFIVNE